MNGNTRITLTIRQLKRLVEESVEEKPVDFIIDDLADMITDSRNFVPITVSSGRLFKGNGYYLDQWEVSNAGYYAGSGSTFTTKNQVWDPSTKGVNFFNGNWNYNSNNEIEGVGKTKVTRWEVPLEQKRNDAADYIRYYVNVAKKKCGNDKNYRVNFLRKVMHLFQFGDDATYLLNQLAERMDDIT